MHPQIPLRIQLHDHARFNNFYPGPNEEVLVGFQDLIHGRGDALLYCSGARGTGKSHLLQAACAQMQQEGGHAWYVPLATMLPMGPSILEGLEQADLICLDDVQAIAGQEMWEEALFHLYNRVRTQGTRLLVAGSDRPEALGLQLADLISRFHWGLLYRLQEMNDAQRLAALQLRARARGLELPDETGEYLLRRSPRDLPALFALLDRLDQAALVAQRRLTIPFVRTILPA